MQSGTSRDSIWPMIKVCGVRSLGDLGMLSSAGVTAVGINLVSHSPRFVGPTLAAELSKSARQLGLVCVAVMMDPRESAIAEAFDQLEIDIVQLHGQESPDVLRQFPDKKFIKAISWSGRREEVQLSANWRSAVFELATSSGLNPQSGLQAFLIDAFAPDVGGGTGRQARWDLLSPRPPELCGIPMILAGGLTPQNLAAAIDATQPQGVDTASGVELSPGRKSLEKTLAFASIARRMLVN